MSPEERLENAANHIVKRNSPTALMADENDDDNRRYMRNALQIMMLPPIDINDAEKVRQRTIEYFNILDKNQMKPGVVGYANALGVDRRDLYAIVKNHPINRHGTMIRIDVDATDIVKKTYQLIEQQWEDNMQNGKINPASGIFLGKNHYGYTDVQEHVLTADIEKKSYDTTDIGSRYLPDSDSDGTVV